ncbi:AbrB/MazE/SpoVT family DNA-binding domain-containing protein [Aminivibrio sp.]
MPQSVRLTQWGNSIGVRLPKDMVNALGLKAGGVLDVCLEESRIVFSPRRIFTLNNLVSKITDENRPGETDWGRDAGKEKWQ